MTRRRGRNVAYSANNDFTVDIFFNQFVGFEHDPSVEIMVEFDRLAEIQGWGNSRRRSQYRRLQDALVNEFNAQYGTDETKLGPWQALCQEVGINPIPVSVTQCKKALARVHVNLVDLVDARRGGGRGSVKVYKTVAQLRKYTLETGKIFPIKHAKAGGVLRALLRPMF